jgi:SEC-C motif-containing protein
VTFGGQFRRIPRAGRNDPCPCGSGEKYKKCCLDKDVEAGRQALAALPEAMAQFAEQAARRERVERALREQYGIFINFVHPVQYRGRKVWAIGSRLYPDRPPNETFTEFIIGVLAGTLGGEWIAEQEAQPEAERHFVRRAYSKHIEWRHRHAEQAHEDGLFAAEPDGWTQYLVSLAFDVASLIHVADLPERLVRRLRHRDQYQGARYEVAIAAIFARLGCRIEFIADDGREKHPEFIATHEPTGIRVAVETKSRHRPGVIHRPGDHDDEAAQRGDVRRLYNEALEQNPGDGTPFMIFVDVNAPPTPGVPVFEKPWARDIREWLRADPKEGEYVALCVTNFSSHYREDDVSVSPESVFIQSEFLAGHLPGEFLTMLLTALDTYGRVPEITEDGALRE